MYINRPADNLRNTIILALNKVENKMFTTKKRMDVAMFSLYFGTDAKIAAQIKYNKDKKKWRETNLLNSEAVKIKSRAANVLTSANKEQASLESSRVDGSTSTANIQVTANAIVQVASDVASIFSIISANDLGSKMFDLAQYAHNVINKTNYDAERVSEVSLIASSETASVSADAVYAQANSTFASINVLSDKLNADLKSINQQMESNGIALDKASETEKRAEGILEDLVMEYKSDLETYIIMQDELNLGLKVILSDEKFSVSFNPVISQIKYPDSDGNIPLEYKPYQPVSSYRIFIVEESIKSTFNIHTAVAIGNKEGLFREVQAREELTTITQEFDLNDSNMIKDTSGNQIEKGKNYVVFIQGILLMEYKKTINDYDDYLSAPSYPFKFTTKLTSATHFIHEGNTVTFIADKYNEDIEYRCMFLRVASLPVSRMQTAVSLERLYREAKNDKEIYVRLEEFKAGLEVEEREKIEEGYEQIEKIMMFIEISSDKNMQDQETINLNCINDTKKSELEEEIILRNAFIKEQEQEIKKIHDDLDKLQVYINLTKELIEYEEKKKQQLIVERTSSIDYLFNKSIAEQVTAGNYTKCSIQSLSENSYKCEINNETKDNYGRILFPDEEYIPVVLTFSKDKGDEYDPIVNSLSDFESTELRIKSPS